MCDEVVNSWCLPAKLSAGCYCLLNSVLLTARHGRPLHVFTFCIVLEIFLGPMFLHTVDMSKPDELFSFGCCPGPGLSGSTAKCDIFLLSPNTLTAQTHSRRVLGQMNASKWRLQLCVLSVLSNHLNFLAFTMRRAAKTEIVKRQYKSRVT